MKKLVALILTLILALGMLAAAQAEPSGDPIKIGLSGMTTGDFVESGLLMMDGVYLAAEEINANGGLLGRPVEIVMVDNASTAQGAVTSVNKILSEDVVACIGPTTSGMVNSALPVFPGSGHPLRFRGDQPGHP